MSSQKTEHYQLHQWQPQDEVRRTEFNENFQLLDGAVRLVCGAYKGDGEATRFIDLGATPRAVWVTGINNDESGVNGGLAFPGIPSTYGAYALKVVTVEEGGFNVYFHSSPNITSNSGGTHHYIALI